MFLIQSAELPVVASRQHVYLSFPNESCYLFGKRKQEKVDNTESIVSLSPTCTCTAYQKKVEADSGSNLISRGSDCRLLLWSTSLEHNTEVSFDFTAVCPRKTCHFSTNSKFLIQFLKNDLLSVCFFDHLVSTVSISHRVFIQKQNWETKVPFVCF